MASVISSTEAPQLQQIDLTKLPIPQLGQLKQQLDQELNLLQDSLQALKLAQSKFQESGESLEKLSPSVDGKPILVPLTGSMYVPGTIANSNQAIIEIGTGYYIKKDIEAAKDYFNRKVKFVTEQMEKIQMMGLEKSKIRDTIIEVIEMKYQEQIAAAAKMATEKK